MISITIIGSGNVAQHLIKAIAHATDLELIQVVARNTTELVPLVAIEKISTDFSHLLPADLYLLAISDDAIASVSDALQLKDKLVAHTSGSVPITALNANNRNAVFYPLQTFTKNKEVNFKKIPICLESQYPEDLILLQKVAQHLSDEVFEINSNQRKSLHVAAVFVCNFVNHLYQIGNAICEENQVPFDILKPLILETASKIEHLSPSEAQTGPAKRKDTLTINSHLSFLKEDYQKEIYKILTKSIIDNDKKL